MARNFDAWLHAPLEREARLEIAYEQWEESGTDLTFEDWLEALLEDDRAF